MCGPIDEEISVPELVKAGTLCPHQDYIWLTRCAGAPVERLQAHRGAVTMVVHDLLNDSTFMDDLLAHAWIRQPESHLADILRSPDAAIALVVVLQSRNARRLAPLMGVLDLTAADAPEMSTTQWEHLIRHYVQGGGFDESPDFFNRRAQLTRRLRADGLMWRRELNLVNSGRRWPRLALSAEKVAACLEIHRMECESRKDSLCQVILTDYIRDEEYRHVTQRSLPLGAWPIFNALARGASHCRREALALHTGRLSIIHESLVSALELLLPPGSIEFAAVPALSDYQAITVRGDHRYLAERPVKIAVESMNQIDPVIRTALEAGATKIDSVGYGLADKAHHMSKVRSLAFEDARDEARVYAGLAGSCLGGVQKINTSPSMGGGFQEIVVTAHKTLRSGEEETYVPGIYSQGKVTLRERVEVVFDLKACK